MPSMNPADMQNWLTTHDPLSVVALPDQLVEQFGHHPRSEYAETYWLGVLGPSALWALRRLVGWLEENPGGFPLPLAPMAAELGLGNGTGRNAPLVRTLSRLVSFEMAAIRSEALAVRTMMPPLARRHSLRLPSHLAERHREEMESGRALSTQATNGATTVGAVGG